MIPILYDSNELSFTSNGLGRLRDCISCMVTEERNGIYECDFSYPVNGANFDLIIPGRIIGVRHDDTEDIQPFDIVSYSKPIDGIVEFHAVHISYRLREMVKTTDFYPAITDLTGAIEFLNAPNRNYGQTEFGWDRYHQFHFSADFNMTARFGAATTVPTAIRSMMGGMEGSIIDSYGGEWEFDKFNVTLHKKRGQDRDFTIRYGVNLTDYKEDTDFSDTYNFAWPYWQGSDGVNDTIRKPPMPVPSEDQRIYAYREIQAPLDLSSKFENPPTWAQLQDAARAYMRNNQTTVPKQTIDVSFIRLQDLGEYEMLETLLQCNLCDTINVVFPAYDMQGRYKIVKTVYDVLRGGYDSMELGTLQTTLAEALGISSESPTNSGADVIYYEDDTVKVNAPIEVNGSVTSNGNKLVSASADGGSGTKSNVATGTTLKNLTSITLSDAGVYLLMGLARFPANANGRRGLGWGSNSTGYFDNSLVVVPPVTESNGITRIQSMAIVTVASSLDVYLNCYHTAGSSLSVDYYWRYIKLA